MSKIKFISFGGLNERGKQCYALNVNVRDIPDNVRIEATNDQDNNIMTFIKNDDIDAYDWTEVENASLIVHQRYVKFDHYKSDKYNEYVDLDGDSVMLGVNAD